MAQLWSQMMGLVAVSTWSILSTWLTLRLIGKAIGGLRVTVENELAGADYVEHAVRVRELFIVVFLVVKKPPCGRVADV